MKKFAKIGAAGSGLLPLAGEQMFAAAVQKAGKATHEWAGSESSAKGFMEVDRVRVDSSKGKKKEKSEGHAKAERKTGQGEKKATEEKKKASEAKAKSASSGRVAAAQDGTGGGPNPDKDVGTEEASLGGYESSHTQDQHAQPKQALA